MTTDILIIGLLIVIVVLLTKDRIKFKRTHRTSKHNESQDAPYDVMGAIQPEYRHPLPINDIEGQIKKQGKALDNFDSTSERDDFDIIVPQEEPEEVREFAPDFEEEEEEWRQYGSLITEDGFATGVTFEELGAVGMLLEHQVLEPPLEIKAVHLVQKLDGTELLSLLENSIEGASMKIAKLLDRTANLPADPGSSSMRNKFPDEFDITDYIQ